MPDAMQRLVDYLAGKGRRVSENGARVVEVILARSGTFTRDDMAEELAGRASRATVYRTFEVMLEADLIRQVELNGRMVFILTADGD